MVEFLRSVSVQITILSFGLLVTVRIGWIILGPSENEQKSKFAGVFFLNISLAQNMRKARNKPALKAIITGVLYLGVKAVLFQHLL